MGDLPLPVLSALLVERDGCFEDESKERHRQIPVFGVVRDYVEAPDGEDAVGREHHADGDGTCNCEASHCTASPTASSSSIRRTDGRRGRGGDEE